ncbi:MAG: heme exporter protein CcmB [Gammaproteobacteria bacterium]
MIPASPAIAVLHREFLRLLRRRGQLVQPLVFFSLVAILFPFALGSQLELAQRAGAGAVWIAVLLATTLSLEEIFRSDFDDGTLEQFVVMLGALPLGCAMKALAHWLTSLVPLIAMATMMGFVYDLPSRAHATLVSTLLLGTPVFSLVGTVASALTVGVRGGALLLALIILPLYIPVLIFGASAVHNAALGLSTTGEHYFLAGLAVLAMTLAPFATAASLRARLS